ncbi:MAG: hypothetical protein IPL16_12985 [Ignavibacteria bacterium]|nr:hypothetical protein [Ignavibacteria bacterium]
MKMTQYFGKYNEFKKRYDHEFPKFVVNYGDEINEEDTYGSNPRSITMLK